MAKKFFHCLSLVLVLSLAIFGTAAAKNAEISNIQAFDINDEILRIEIALEGNVKPEDVTTQITSGMLTLELDNTTPGRISKISGTKISSEKLIKKITVKETSIGHTKVRISLNATPAEDSFNMSVQPANRAEKLPARVVIDFDKESLKVGKDKKSEKPVDEEKQTFKVGDKVIVIDAGHGGSDTGAVGPHGLTEKEVTLAVALKTEKILKAEGMKVVMTRRTDIDVASADAPNNVELQARVDKTPPQANLFISIHCNAFSNPKSHGMETYYSTANQGGQRLAQLLNEELAQHGKIFNRGVKAANFYVIKRAKCPASLIELAFITNPDEEELLDDEHYQNVLAGAIANAVKRFFAE